MSQNTKQFATMKLEDPYDTNDMLARRCRQMVRNECLIQFGGHTITINWLLPTMKNTCCTLWTNLKQVNSTTATEQSERHFK